MKRAHLWLLQIGLVVTACLVAGCGDKGPTIYRVSGTATHQGKPVPNMIVHFFPEHGRPSWGLTDKDGKYDLDFDPERRGAQAGKHKVHVEFRAADPGQEHLERTGQASIQDIRGAILDKYSEQNSKLTVEVNQENQVIDLKLD